MNIKKELAKSFQFFLEKKYQNALEILDEVIKKDPKNFNAFSNKAIILLNINKKTEAKFYFEKALSISFDIKIANNFINFLINEADWQYAEKINNKLIEKFGKLSKYQKNKVLILKGQKNYDETVWVLKELIDNNPNEIELLIDLSVCLDLAEKYEEAINILNNYFIFKKNNLKAFLLYALIKIKLNDCNEAKKYIKKILKSTLHGNDDVQLQNEALFLLGVIDQKENRNSDAILKFKDVINKNKNHIEANYSLGIEYLKIKDFKNAALHNSYRVKRNNKDQLVNDLYYESINSNSMLLVIAEQGVGDQLILIRLLEEIRKKVKQVVYVSINKLEKFISYNLENINVICISEYLKNYKIYEHFIKINLHSIFRYIDDPLKVIKKSSPFDVDNDLFERYKRKYSSDKKLIGISWKSLNIKENHNDFMKAKKKSLTLTDLCPILKKTDIFNFINLQYGQVKSEIEKINLKFNTELIYDNELDYFDDIYSLAALIKCCHTVITCSNVTAHISGLLGVNTYLMLPKNNGKLWYWYENENKSSWYPSIQIITQEYDGDWGGAIDTLKKTLKIY